MYLNLKDSELDTYIYRIISLERLLELFVTNKNILVKPLKWEDTFENFILKSKLQSTDGETIEHTIHDEIYGQCWTLQKASDAMWRIYSPNKDSLRIRTTVKDLIESINKEETVFSESKTCIGKVEYLNDKRLMDFADNIFINGGISAKNIFKSLLVKRRAFIHESEVRLLFHYWDTYDAKNEMYSYNIDPHKLISQIMIDPRKTYSEFKTIKKIIHHATGYNKDAIQRSLLYRTPKEKILTVTHILKEDYLDN